MSLRELEHAVDAAEDQVDMAQPSGKPKYRFECKDGPRPCPFVSCRHHLYLEAERSGSLKFNQPGVEVENLQNSCALDVAEEGGLTLDDTAKLLGLTRERVRQIQDRALLKLKNIEPELDLPEDTSSRQPDVEGVSL